MMTNSSPRGFALLIAVVLASVSLSVGLALLDIAYKQVLLSSGARQSQVAFYNADSALECALYYDQQMDAFAYGNTTGSITCNSQSITVSFNNAVSPRTRTFTYPCPSGGSMASTTITKAANKATSIYANGYNVCNSADIRRVERGLKISY